MINRVLRQLTSGAGSRGARGRHPRGGRRRQTRATGGGRGAQIGAQIERFIRGRR